MSIYDDDLPPGEALLNQFQGRLDNSDVTRTESLLATIADELHHLNQQISDRYL